MSNDKPLTWIAYDPSISDYLKNREQFNGEKPAWGESMDDFLAKQGVPVPEVGDQTVDYRRLEQPEYDGDGNRVTGYYWTIIVR